MVIYLAGPVKGNPNYKRDFGDAQRTLWGLGFHVLNPASLPEGMEDNQYMPICISMVEQAEAVLLWEGWEKSLGAIAEALYAAGQDSVCGGCLDHNQMEPKDAMVCRDRRWERT